MISFAISSFFTVVFKTFFLGCALGFKAFFFGCALGIGTAGGGFAGYGMYVLGYPGDYLDVTNHQVVSAKRFQRDYELVQTK